MAGAVMKATQSVTQDGGTGATPAAGAQAGVTEGAFTTSDAIPWKPVDPEKPNGLQMFVVWGNPNEGASVRGRANREAWRHQLRLRAGFPFRPFRPRSSDSNRMAGRLFPARYSS
jgi:hypothetical protein